MSDSPFTRIGLLGGTFNPVHNCHLSIAGQAQRALALDRVIFIP
ncbi:MAG: nicotinate-nicotinamide nucleotide adenylyltransferase, partial [Nitrospira sp. SB0667_bin_9]|nr:nicotinate-nicotinamide nucleotide adenylyltransferase [Nitrospira sp. SB0667_bin_9]